MSGEQVKILFISARSDMGGGPKHMHELLSHIREKYQHIAIYSATPLDLPYGNKLKKLSLKHFKIPARAFCPLTFLRLLNFCKKESINIIHSHGRGAGLYSRLLAIFNMKVIHTFHGAHNEKSLIGKIKLKLDQLLSSITDQFICVSESEKEKALKLKMALADRTTIIPNGIDQNLIDEQIATDLKSKFDIPENKRIWGTLTRLSPEKGNDQFLKAIKEQEESLKDYVFVFAGSGPQEKQLKEITKTISGPSIKFIGQEKQPISFLKGLDGFFSYSLGEGLPYAVLEALACEKPCVLSNVSGHREFSQEVTFFGDSIEESLIMAQKSKLPAQFSISNSIKQTVMLYRIK